MKAFETIRLETDSRGVARLTLNRPTRHNALDAKMISELTEAAQHIAADPAARVVVLTATGKSFCAGADLEWMKQQFDASSEDRSREAKRPATMLRAIDELPNFVIGVVEGATY